MRFYIILGKQFFLQLSLILISILFFFGETLKLVTSDTEK